MHTFSRYFRQALLISTLVAGVLISGCRGLQEPDPSMTAVRTGTGSGADYISPEDIARANALGLSMRDPDMMDGNRDENLLSTVYFDFDQSFVRPADRTVLQEAATQLESNPGTKLLVEGHCDWRGTTEYNMALGDKRAVSVLTYMEQLGISADRLETVSKGDLEAITEGSEEEMRMDRRADLFLVQ